MENLKELLSEAIFAKTGLRVSTESIITDERGIYYYIHPKSLLSSHPLLLNHYRGYLFPVIPYKDYQELESGNEHDAITYVQDASWSFGAFYGGGSAIGGIYYKPISDKAEILNYMTIMSCRVHLNSSGYRPTEEMCQKCSLEKCWFSSLEEKRKDSEVCDEPDLRRIFASMVIKKVEKTLGINANMGISFGEEDDDNKAMLYYFPGFVGSEPYVRVDLNGHTFLKMLCTPNDFDNDSIKEVAESCKLVLAKFPRLNGNEVIRESLALTEGDDAPAVAKEFWEIGKEKVTTVAKSFVIQLVSPPKKSLLKRLLNIH